MKKLMTTKIAVLLVLLFTLASSASFADAAGELTPKVKISFRQDFRTASLLSSEVHDKFVKVTFAMDNVIQEAYYTKGGQLLAVVHNILSGNLPADLQLDLKKQLKNYWITELFELDKDSDTYYYVSLENANEVLNLRATPDHGWEVFSRIEKN